MSITDEVPFEIPDSWEWARWGSISESIQYGYNAPAQDSGRIKMVRISDIQDGQVIWDSVPYCNIPENDIDTYLLRKNDILFARTGGTVGKSYLVQNVPEEAVYNELTKKPIRDASGRMIERDNYLIDGINCSPDTYGRECAAVNRIYGKNTGFNEVKAHHYIVSFDPDDKTENGLTMEHAHELGMKLAEDCFPGHQVIVCTHPDGHNGIGNIHCHIVLNSVRKDDIEEQRFTERSSDLIAGNKHHCSEGFMTFFKQEVMDSSFLSIHRFRFSDPDRADCSAVQDHHL